MPDHSPVQTSQPDTSFNAAQKSVAFADAISGSGPRVYDARTLNELQDIFGRPKLMDLLGCLKVEIGNRLHAPATARVTLGQDAHTLLSVSGSLGFVDLSRRCSEMEQACLMGADLVAPLEAARRAAAQAIAAIGALEADA